MIIQFSILQMKILYVLVTPNTTYAFTLWACFDKFDMSFRKKVSLFTLLVNVWLIFVSIWQYLSNICNSCQYLLIYGTAYSTNTMPNSFNLPVHPLTTSCTPFRQYQPHMSLFAEASFRASSHPRCLSGSGVVKYSGVSCRCSRMSMRYGTCRMISQMIAASG